MTDDHHITRRRLVAGALATGAAAALPDAAAAAKKKKAKRRRTRRADVVIVGAGFAGLTAARELTRAGRSVVVLEARNRVGGRALNKRLGVAGKISEAGATFVGPTQDHVIDLGKAYGVELFPTFNTGENVYLAGGQRSTFSDTGVTGSAPSDPVLLPDLANVVTDLNTKSAEVPVDAPWTAARAGEYDGQTFESYINANAVTPQFKTLAAAAARPIFGAEPRELSLLFVLFYIAASGNERNPGNFERNFNTRNGAQESRFAGGSQVIPIAMASELGRRVVLRSPVRRIAQSRSGVKVVCDRMTVDAKHVIVAIPPTLAGRIDYRPNLPADRDALTQRLPQGRLLKVTAIYDKPFWRDKGLTGQALSVDGFVSATFDDSPEDGTPGVVFGFVGGDKARALVKLSDAERRATVLGEFARFFGDEARNPTGFFITNWTEQTWSRGCPVGVYGAGTLLAYGDQIRQPVGRIHWAGTETSTYWNGYMDGAVRSGERAAAEVLGA